MEIFEYLRTAFHVVKAFVTQDKLIYIGLGILGLFILWTVLCLCLCHEAKMSRLWQKMEKELNGGEVTKEKYFAFTKYIQKMPTTVQRNWKKYENLKVGVPSDYILQQDMLDNPISGGMRKQNRSLMKFAMWSVTILFFFLSFASLGATNALTAKIVIESAIVPFVLFLFYRLNYYIYTTVRQYEYRLAVDDFNEFMDFVDSKIDIQELFDGAEDYLQVNSNCYEYAHKTKPHSALAEREVQPLPIKKEKKVATVESGEQIYAKQEKEYEFPRSKSGKIELRSRQDFSEALVVVEKLLETKPTTAKQNDTKSKRVAELMEAMNKYRNKKLK